MREVITGTVFDIQRFSIHDGPGIRTTLFLKGCPLHCPWCHNPESQQLRPEILFQADECIGCAACVEVCPKSCHLVSKEQHVFDRTDCIHCGACALRCPTGALEQAGDILSVDDVMCEVLKDEPYYNNSEGGMTISGGEPMSQFAFTRALLRAGKDAGLHTCLDTCGVAPRARYLEIASDVDIFLWDYKESDPSRHLELTGGELDPILATLRELDRRGAKTILRCPIIPGINDRRDHFDAIGQLADSLENVLEVQIEPFHRLGVGKYARLGKPNPMPDILPPAKEQTIEWVRDVVEKCSKEVRLG